MGGRDGDTNFYVLSRYVSVPLCYMLRWYLSIMALAGVRFCDYGHARRCAPSEVGVLVINIEVDILIRYAN